MSRFPYEGFLEDMIDIRRSCVFTAPMVPVVLNGVVYGANANGPLAPPPSNITVQDYVLGLFALCLWNAPPIALCDGWVATRESFEELPSRWADRAHALHRAFGPDRTREIADYLRSSNIGVDLANVEDHVEIRRFETPRQAVIGCALIRAMRDRNPDRAELLERARFAEPQATEEEIEAAAHATSDILAALSAEDDLVRSEGAR